MQMRLAKLLGPALSALADGDDVAQVGKGIQLLFASNSPEDVLGLLKQCVVGVSRDGVVMREADITTCFSGDQLGELYQVFFFVLRTNFSGFMKGSLAQGLLAKVGG